jgi:hypothetical protein
MVAVNVRSFAELVAGDEMAGRFTGWGFNNTGFLTVEASCELRQREVARSIWPPLLQKMSVSTSTASEHCMSTAPFTTASSRS